MLSRIRAEREQPIGDLLWGGSPEMYAINDDLFAKAELPEARHFKQRDPAGKWHPYSLNVIYLVVNTTRVARVPASYREVLSPAFRAQGPIGLSNPTVSGTAYTILTSLVTALGWDFVDSMLRNVWLTDSSDSMFKWVKDGETAALAELQKDLKILKEEVDEEDIAEVVARWSGIPLQRLLEGELEKLLRMEARLAERVVGQERAVRAISDAVRRASASVRAPRMAGT